MSKSTLYFPGGLRLRPGMTMTMDDKGRWSGTAEFTCATSDSVSNQIHAQIRQGSQLSDITSDVPIQWGFMRVESLEIRDEPGGFSIVTLNLKGFIETQWDFDGDRTKVYTRNSSLQEESILNHPKFKSEVPFNRMFKLALDGQVAERSDSTAEHLVLTSVGNGLDGKVVYETTNAEFIKWWVIIIKEGTHTYLNTRSEWTMQTTGKNPLSDAEVAKLGYIDDPDGNPGTPEGQNWILSGISESIQVTGEGSNSYSKTWTASGQAKFDAEVYTKFTEPE